MSKVTVIVAAYNAEQFIGKCLDSLERQTLRDIQIVCSDDGSADGTPRIIADHARRDGRIRLVRSDVNRGLAKARNAALAVADGDYVCMLDADDWYSPDALEKAAAVLDANPLTGCVLFDCVLAYPDGRREPCRSKPFDVIPGAEALVLSLDWNIHGIYMTRAEIHKKYPYDDACRLYSDENTTRMHYAASAEVRTCDGVYYYLQHPASATHKASALRFDRMRADASLRRHVAALGVGPEVEARLDNIAWLHLVDTYMFYHCHGRGLSRAERRAGLAEMRKAWAAADRKALDAPVARKFGYRPMPSWPLFRLQEWAYFTLRGLLGKNE